MKRLLLPKRIVDSASVNNAERLLKNDYMQIGLNEPDLACVDGGYIVLDFGRELCGGIRILTFSSDGRPARLRFGESVSECYCDIGSSSNATNDHALRDFCVMLPGYSDQKFGCTGFRFVRLDFDGKVAIKNIFADASVYSRRPRYVYSGNDRECKQIFDIAKYTVDLCVQNGYVWDGIKRDRLVWAGDMYPEMLALTRLYGRVAQLERSLEFVRDQTPPGEWMNFLPGYSMQWIITVADYYARTGADDFAVRQLNYIDALVQRFLQCVDQNGTLDYPDYFVDWESRDGEDERAGVRAINIIAAKKAKELLSAFGRDTSACDIVVSRLLKQEISVVSGKSVAALKHFAVGISEKDRELLLSGGARGLSTFMAYHILCAIASFDKAAAVRIMKEYYGKMISLGATTFWETFDIGSDVICPVDRLPGQGELTLGDTGKYCYKGFRRSLCHGWAAGVIEFIATL